MTVANSLDAIPVEAQHLPRRLVLLFDGTWNKRESTTNVWRMRTLLRTSQDQCVYYDEGVGTAKGEKITGGVFGSGISAKVLSGYLWLMEHYEGLDESLRGVADEVFIFGFSRGATCARSLGGLLSISGLLHMDAATRVRDAFDLSRVDGLKETDQIARDFRRRHSRPIQVKFLGVWDTVQSLGLPKMSGFPYIKVPWFEHNAQHKVVNLPSIVQHARHALAIDERRRLFDATLWPEAQPKQTMEQRWFSGAHANVGGGYERDGLFRRPLQWLQAEASALGLQFREPLNRLGDEFYASMPRDSLGEIGYGMYYTIQNFKPHTRDMNLGGLTRECIDYTALERWLWNPGYEPVALRKLLGAKRKRRLPANQLTDQQLGDLLTPLHISSTRGYVF
jgi:uncharacterized protein (DUF2235 family)